MKKIINVFIDAIADMTYMQVCITAIVLAFLSGACFVPSWQHGNEDMGYKIMGLILIIVDVPFIISALGTEGNIKEKHSV